MAWVIGALVLGFVAGLNVGFVVMSRATVRLIKTGEWRKAP